VGRSRISQSVFLSGMKTSLRIQFLEIVSRERIIFKRRHSMILCLLIFFALPSANLIIYVRTKNYNILLSIILAFHYMTYTAGCNIEIHEKHILFVLYLLCEYFLIAILFNDFVVLYFSDLTNNNITDIPIRAFHRFPNLEIL